MSADSCLGIGAHGLSMSANACLCAGCRAPFDWTCRELPQGRLTDGRKTNPRVSWVKKVKSESVQTWKLASVVAAGGIVPPAVGSLQVPSTQPPLAVSKETSYRSLMAAATCNSEESTATETVTGVLKVSSDLAPLLLPP